MMAEAEIVRLARYSIEATRWAADNWAGCLLGES